MRHVMVKKVFFLEFSPDFDIRHSLVSLLLVPKILLFFFHPLTLFYLVLPRFPQVYPVVHSVT